MAAPETPITCDIDLDAEGKQTGYLRLPHSVHRSAYGCIHIPIASIRNGDGPTVLVMAGNHGDEYEGQIIVSRLIQELTPSSIHGQLILLPMANYPAAKAGLRTSPLDGGNLNRSFPGNSRGTPTEIIADFIEHHLLSRVTMVFDLHSGGSSLRYDGANLLTLNPDTEQERLRLYDLLKACGLQRALLYPANPVTISSAARRQGAFSLVAELGGSGNVDPVVLQHAWYGILRGLTHLGILSKDLAADQPRQDTRVMRVDGIRHHLYTLQDGIFEPLVALGTDVCQGQAIARIHTPEIPGSQPQVLLSPGNGQIICQRAPALSQRGDCLFQLAADVEDC